jgi:hypothetical protein
MGNSIEHHTLNLTIIIRTQDLLPKELDKIDVTVCIFKQNPLALHRTSNSPDSISNKSVLPYEESTRMNP